MAKHIICRGMPVEVGFTVKTWMDTGWRFPTVRARTITRAVCAHWTASENPPGTMFRNMSKKLDAFGKASPLSVHFCVNQNGAVYQMADTEARCVHAGDANAYSIGIEFIGRGSDMKVSSKGIDRELVTERIHGGKVTYYELLPAQVEAGVRLIEALCSLYALPMVVPEDELGDVRLEELDLRTLSTFRGVIGHMHVHANKSDCGARLLRAVQARGKALPVA